MVRGGSQLALKAVALAVVLGPGAGCVRLTGEDWLAVPATAVPRVALQELSGERGRVEVFPVTVGDRVMSAYYSSAPDSTGVVLFCGGSGDDTEPALRVLVPPTRDLGLDLVVFPYYLEGEAVPSVIQTRAALQALYTAVADRSPRGPGSIYVIGHSLGAWFAMDLAGTHPTGGLVLVGAGARPVDILRAQYDVFAGMVRLDRDDNLEQLDARRYAPRVKVPTLVVSSERDEAVPPDLADEVFALLTAAPSKRQVVLGGAGHGGYFKSDYFWEEFRAFFGLEPGRMNGAGGPIDVWHGPKAHATHARRSETPTD